jgi:hypothetical protein
MRKIKIIDNKTFYPCWDDFESNFYERHDHIVVDEKVLDRKYRQHLRKEFSIFNVRWTKDYQVEVSYYSESMFLTFLLKYS